MNILYTLLLSQFFVNVLSQELKVTNDYKCPKKEECILRTDNPRNRYMEINQMVSREGIGASLDRVAYVIHQAIAYGVEPVINGPILASHGSGNFGDWWGLTNNSYLNIVNNISSYNNAEKHILKNTNEFKWDNKRDIVYVLPKDARKVEKKLDWISNVHPQPKDSRVCNNILKVMSFVFWSVHRTRCNQFLTIKPSEKHPWVVAVHVRRGDILALGSGRIIPHVWFEQVVSSVLVSILSIDPDAHVHILVFSEGDLNESENEIYTELNEIITWDIVSQCDSIGLVCTQKTILSSQAIDCFDCLATADILIGSKSTFSRKAAYVSTNVKFFPYEDSAESKLNFWEVLNLNQVLEYGVDQDVVNENIKNWWYCSREQNSDGYQYEMV